MDEDLLALLVSSSSSSWFCWARLLPLTEAAMFVLQDVGGASSQTDQSDDEDKENEPDDDDGGGGWITPSNIRQLKMESSDWTEAADVRVGCLTTDFAMQVRPGSGGGSAVVLVETISVSVFRLQNVLIQMGLHVLSVNGLLIKRARSYILRCHACFRSV